MTREQGLKKAREKADLYGGSWYVMQRGAHDFKVIDERTKREIFWAVVGEAHGEGAEIETKSAVETGANHGL